MKYTVLNCSKSTTQTPIFVKLLGETPCFSLNNHGTANILL